MIALSGDYRSKKEVAYTLVPAIGRRVIDLGGNVEKGDSVVRSRAHTFFFLLKPVAQAPTFKLIGNSLILGSIELISEAYTVAEKSGIGQDLVYEYIKGMDGFGSSPLRKGTFCPLKSPSFPVLNKELIPAPMSARILSPFQQTNSHMFSFISFTWPCCITLADGSRTEISCCTTNSMEPSVSPSTAASKTPRTSVGSPPNTTRQCLQSIPLTTTYSLLAPCMPPRRARERRASPCSIGPRS